jgi:hypothetical protein
MSNIYGAGLAPNSGGLYALTCSQCHTVYASSGSSIVSWCPSCLNAQNATHSHTYTTPHTNDSPHALLRMIGMRLRKAEGASLGFECLYPVRSGEKVCTMVIQDGVAQIIEDEWGLFPSDGFITKLRLLEK